MSALGLFRSGTTPALNLRALITTPQRTPHLRCLSTSTSNATTKLAAQLRQVVEAVMANPQLNDLQKYRILERLHAAHDSDRAGHELAVIQEKRLEARQQKVDLSPHEEASLTEEVLAQDKAFLELRSRNCKMCVFAPWGEAGLRERMAAAAPLFFVGGIVAPANRFFGRLLLRFKL